MRTSRQRFLIGFFLVQLLLALVAVPRMYYRNEAGWEAQTHQMLHDKAVILDLLAAASGEIRQSGGFSELKAGEHGLIYRFYDANGALLHQFPPGEAADPLPLELRERILGAGGPMIETSQDRRLGEVRAAAVARWIREGEGGRRVHGFAQVLLPMAEHRAQQRLRLAQVALGAIVACGLTFLAAAWLSDRWLHGLKLVAESARRLSEKDLPAQRLPVPEGEPELAEFARACNHMLDRLESSYSARQRFIADAAHELRTPLTILRGEIDVALRRPREADRYRQVLESNREEIQRVTHLLDSLLVLARADANRALPQKEPVHLHALCLEVQGALAGVAEARQVAVRVEGEANASVLGDRLALHRVFWNLLENALHNTPAGESIAIRIGETVAETLVEVIDTGPGIPAEEIPKLFQRFYRVAKSPRRPGGGAGLGLAIVQSLVEAHGGRVSIASEVGKGTTVTVRFPKGGA